MAQFLIRVKDTVEGNTARVGGQNFSKLEATLVNAVELTDEIRNSPLLDVTPVAEEPEAQADAKLEAPVPPVVIARSNTETSKQTGILGKRK